MIKNVLDNYMSDNLIRCMKTWALPFGVEVMAIERNKIKTIYIKDRRFEDSYYKPVLNIRKEDSILFLSNLIQTQKEFINAVKEYQKQEV